MRHPVQRWLTLCALLSTAWAGHAAHADTTAAAESLDLTRANTWEACRRYCNGQVGAAQDEFSNPRRVKIRDITRLMLEASDTDDVRLLRIKNPTPFTSLTRSIGSPTLNYDVSISYEGARVRLRTRNDDMSLSVRSSPPEYEPGEVVMGVGIELRW